MRAFDRRAGLFAGALLLAAGALGGPAAAADKLRVGKPSATGFEFSALEIGIQKGFFARHGIEIETLVLAGSRNQQALAAGSTDIALGTGVELALMAKGSPAKGVAVMAGPPLNMSIVVRPDAVPDIAALKGRQVGVTSTAALTAWLAKEFSRRQGWTTGGIDATALGSPEGMVAGLVSKNVDAIVISVVEGYRLERAGRAKVLTDFRAIDDFLVHVIFASDALIRDNPDAVRRFLAGWFETIDFMFANRAEAIRLSLETTQLPQDLAEKVYDQEMPMFSRDGRFPPAAVKVIKQSFIDLGQLTEQPDDKILFTEAFLPKR